MTPPGGNGADKSLGEIVNEVSEKASLLVREEIELAKSEVAQKAKTLARGAGVGIAAGIFLVFAVVMMLNALAWLINDALDTNVVWPGFAIVTAHPHRARRDRRPAGEEVARGRPADARPRDRGGQDHARDARAPGHRSATSSSARPSASPEGTST